MIAKVNTHVEGDNIALKTPPSKRKKTAIDFVRVYYEHQYDRMAKQEEYRLSITNYVLSISALAYTFGYQNATILTVVNGIGLPLIIIFANLFAMATIDRTRQYALAHRDRAHEVVKRYAPELMEINKLYQSDQKGIFGKRTRLQKGIHVLLILTAIIPVLVYLYQVYR